MAVFYCPREGSLVVVANVDWRVPGTSDYWSITANWTGLIGEALPWRVLFADPVTIGGSNSAYIVTFDVPIATLSSLTIEGGNGAEPFDDPADDRPAIR